MGPRRSNCRTMHRHKEPKREREKLEEGSTGRLCRRGGGSIIMALGGRGDWETSTRRRLYASCLCVHGEKRKKRRRRKRYNRVDVVPWYVRNRGRWRRRRCRERASRHRSSRRTTRWSSRRKPPAWSVSQGEKAVRKKGKRRDKQTTSIQSIKHGPRQQQPKRLPDEAARGINDSRETSVSKTSGKLLLLHNTNTHKKKKKEEEESLGEKSKNPDVIRMQLSEEEARRRRRGNEAVREKGGSCFQFRWV